MGIFNKPKKGGFADVIRCDEPEYLVWKWHPNGVAAGKGKRETALRTGSVLRVKSGETAVFVYKKSDGTTEDYIEGPFQETIKTKNFPILSSIIGVWYEGDTPFQAEVFFINVAQAMQIRFGVPYFNVVDPRFPDFEIPVAVRGSVTFGISDVKQFVKCHQLATFTLNDFKKKVNDAVVRYVKNAVAEAPMENGIPVINLESKIDVINEKAELSVKKRLSEMFGIEVKGLDISTIELDKESPSYEELKRVTKDLVKRQAEANVINYEEQLRIQREEGQYAQHMATRQTNLGAYQTEKSAQVGVAGAEALGKMGANGAGQVNMGSGAGFNPMTMMAGMAVGSAVGQNIAGTMNGAINPNAASVPPAIPTVTYYYAVDGKPVGPVQEAQLKELIVNGTIQRDSLVWKSGTPAWAAASSFAEFSTMFPPILP